MKNQVYVIGPMGSKREDLGQKISKERNLEYFSLDDEIQKEDGRSPKKICMTMGEHAYHDKEYHKLVEFKEKDNFVLVLGDGAIFDSMCEDIIGEGEVVLCDFNKSPDDLWEAVKKDDRIPYAFVNMMKMDIAGEEESKKIFMSFYDSRKPLYEKYVKETL